MDNGAAEADQVVRLVLQGSVFLLKVSGSASMEIMKFLSAAASDNSKSSGKIRLKNLLQSGSELKVFTLQGDENFREFASASRKYGVIYSVVKRDSEDKQNGIYDIMVKAEDAAKINRIIERYGLVEVKGNAQAVEADENKAQFESVADIRELLSKMLQPSDQQNPELAPEEIGYLSGASSVASRRVGNLPDNERTSVVQELKDSAENKMPGDGIANLMNLMLQYDEESEDKNKEGRTEMMTGDDHPVSFERNEQEGEA